MKNMEMLFRIAAVVTILAIQCQYSLGASIFRSSNQDEIVYDQRQNGSENIHAHINDVAMVDIPAEMIVFLSSSANNEQMQALMELLGKSSLPILQGTEQPSTESISEEAQSISNDIISTVAPSSASESSAATTLAQSNENSPKKTKGRHSLSKFVLSFLRKE